MSVKENKELMRWAYEEVNKAKGNADKLTAILDKWMTRESVYHTPTGDRNFEQYKQGQADLHVAFPDMIITVEDMIAAGDKVVARWIARGTHKGTFMGIAPTGKTVTISGIAIARFAKGKAVEGWGLQDTLGMMQQLGAIPSGPSKK